METPLLWAARQDVLTGGLSQRKCSFVEMGEQVWMRNGRHCFMTEGDDFGGQSSKQRRSDGLVISLQETG